MVAPTLQNLLGSLKVSAHDAQFDLLMRSERSLKEQQHQELLKRPAGGANPYQLHARLGQEMTKAATVVRRNDQLRAAYEVVSELHEQALTCSLSDTGTWTNQNVMFTKALIDMFPLAKVILKGALQRDECRGAHYKPEFDMPGVASTDPAERRHQAEKWCDLFEEKNRKWLKSTIAEMRTKGDPVLTYEEVDTSLVPPRPRLYGIVGGDIIEQVWAERQQRGRSAGESNGSRTEEAKSLGAS
jgi:succinate dehydrogenase / fumarate reductase flavoprotein subunit